jgi:long-chain acyl-CoA synthetase
MIMSMSRTIEGSASSPSAAPRYDEVLGRLVGPGGPFEMKTQLTERGTRRTFIKNAGSVRELLLDAAERRGQREFLVQGSRRVTFGQFAELAWGVAASLTRTFGMQPGDRLAVLGPNSIDWLAAMFGATSAGAIGVALNHMWSTDELIFALRDCGARFVVVDQSCATHLAEAMTKASLDSITVFVVGDPLPSRFHSADELLRPLSEPPDQPIQCEEPFVILYSSGTSARPKGCITTHMGTVTQLKGMILAGLINKEISSAPPTRANRQAASLLTGPLFHVAGLHAAVGGSLVTGMKLVLTEASRFDAFEILQLIQQEQITHWGAVPTIVQRVFEHPSLDTFNLSSLESVSIGGAPVTATLLERVRSVLGAAPRLGNGWGMTETHGGITMNAGKELAEHAGSVGRAHPYLDIRVVDDALCDKTQGETGELLVRGPTVFAGYWNRPRETTDTIRDGWLRTGDIGYIDDTGFVYLVDRASDLIIRGGENISSVEIEDILSAHPDVVEAAVLGVPDKDLGERVVAFVRLHPDAGRDDAALRNFARQRLAAYKVPAEVHFVNGALPTNAAGKVMKRTLREGLTESEKP